MRKKYIGLIICIISTNQVLCNVSMFENKFIFTAMMALQDTTLEDKTEILFVKESESSKLRYSFVCVRVCVPSVCVSVQIAADRAK